jgi:hypothetical protein
MIDRERFRNPGLSPARAAVLAREAAAALREELRSHARPASEAVDALGDLLFHPGDTRVAASSVGPFFSGVIEPLADSDEVGDRRALEAVLARLLLGVPAAGRGPEVSGGFRSLLERFGFETEAAMCDRVEQLATPRPCRLSPEQVQRVILFSRVTIGADVLLTGLALAKLRRRFPDAGAVFIGPEKNAGVLSGARELEVRPVRYPRGGPFADRLETWTEVVAAVEAVRRDAGGDVLVVNLDSRLLQSGLLPVLPASEEAARYRFWEPTRQPDRGPTRHWSLAGALGRWLDAVFGPEPDGRAVHPVFEPPSEDLEFAERLVRARRRPGGTPLVAVNLGVGGNLRKRVTGGEDSHAAAPSRFERDLLLGLLGHGNTVLLDEGFGPDENELAGALAAAARAAGHRVARVPESADPGPRANEEPEALVTVRGSIGRLAAVVARSDLYVGYDSVGPHLAGAAGRDVIAVFAGYDHPEFPDRWRSAGPGTIEIVRAGPGPFPEGRQAELAREVLSRVAEMRSA